MKALPRSLFGRAALTIALTLVSFTIVSMAAVVYFIMLPMAKRSADDFAAEFVSAAHDLQHLPEERHTELMQELLDDHGLVVVSHEPGLIEQQVDSPYLMFFRDSLTRVAGEDRKSVV